MPGDSPAAGLKLRHAVVTSVTRDDLPDQGAGQFAACLRELRALCPDTTVELLIPDMQGREDLLDIILAERPDVLNHNVVYNLSPSCYLRFSHLDRYEVRL